MDDDLLAKLGGFTQQVHVERQPSRGWAAPPFAGHASHVQRCHFTVALEELLIQVDELLCGGW